MRPGDDDDNDDDVVDDDDVHKISSKPIESGTAPYDLADPAIPLRGVLTAVFSIPDDSAKNMKENNSALFLNIQTGPEL